MLNERSSNKEQYRGTTNTTDTYAIRCTDEIICKDQANNKTMAPPMRPTSTLSDYTKCRKLKNYKTVSQPMKLKNITGYYTRKAEKVTPPMQMTNILSENTK